MGEGTCAAYQGQQVLASSSAFLLQMLPLGPSALPKLGEFSKGSTGRRAWPHLRHGTRPVFTHNLIQDARGRGDLLGFILFECLLAGERKPPERVSGSVGGLVKTGRSGVGPENFHVEQVSG